ncbi:MAG: S-layer homology domain-containing protein [bacterium]|jgi:hypothetical protein
MKRTVRLMVTVLVLMAMLFSLVPQIGLAAPKWTGNSGNPGKGPKIKFKDIEKNWAKNYIEQLTAAGIFQGITEDLFAPDDSVESVQVLVTLVRALGYEEAAQKYQRDKDTIRNMAGIPAWARGYVRVALEKGLINDKELANLRPGQKATRLDVARFISRLFDENDWLDDFDLPGLRDLNDLPNNLKAYIVLVAKKGIMVGTPDGRWLPYDLVNRGQMAKIMSLIISRLANRTEQQTQVYGEIVRLRMSGNREVPILTVKTKQDTYDYIVSDDCIVYVDGKQADLDDLARGQRVRLVLTRKNGTQEVAYIRAENQDDEEITVDGVINALTKGQGASITVKDSRGKETTFEVTDDTVITLDGREVFLSDLKLGQNVTVEGVEEDKGYVAIEIAAESNEEEITGTIKTVVTRTRPSLSVEDSRGRSYTFSVTGRTRIRLNGEVVVLEDLRPKDKVKVRAVDREALRIDAEREKAKEEEIEGKITALVLGANPSISIRIKGRAEHTYLVDEDDTRIYVDEKRSTLDALRVGWQVELRVLADEALVIWAESPEDGGERTIEGELVQIKLGSQDFVTIEHRTGRMREYRVDKKARFFIEDERVNIDELEIGCQVELLISDGVVYEIRAED